MSVSKNSLGFTLVEIMIVVSLIGMLAAIGIPTALEASWRARESRFSRDIQTASHAFLNYALEHGDYPADSHLALPPTMVDLINPQIWADPTPLGGNYNWEGPDTYPFAGLSIFQPTADIKWILTLDGMLDNGDLATGNFRMVAGRPTLIIEDGI